MANQLTYRQLQRELKQIRNRNEIPSNVKLNQRKTILKGIYDKYIVETKRIQRRVNKKQKKEKRKDIIEQKLQYKQQKAKRTKAQKELLRTRKHIYDVVISAVYSQKHHHRPKDGPWLITFQYGVRIENGDLNNIRSKIMDYLKKNDLVNFEDEYFKYKLQDFQYKVSDVGKFITKNKKTEMHVPMLRAKPLVPGWLSRCEHINKKSFEDYDNECCYYMLKEITKYTMNHIEIHMEAAFHYCANLYKEEPFYKQKFSKKIGITPAMILKFAQTKNIPCYGYNTRDKMFMSYRPGENTKKYIKPIAFYCVLGHMYIITESKMLRSLSHMGQQNRLVSTKCIEETKSEKNKKWDNMEYKEDVDVKELSKLSDTIVFYNTTNLMDLFKKYIATYNTVPSHTFENTINVSSIMLPKNVILMKNEVVGLGFNWKHTKKICNHLQIPFKNQSIGKLLFEIMTIFEKNPRKRYNNSEKKTILAKQGHKCNICKKQYDTYEYDHKKPLIQGGSNEFFNIQALCKSCHFNKTRDEQDMQYSPMKIETYKSIFNHTTYRLITSDVFKRWAFIEKKDDWDEDEITEEEKKLKEFQMDLVKCRRTLFMFFETDYPVYSVLDEIEKFDKNKDKIKVGNYFVESTNNFPLRGNGWYSHVLIQYCLDNGIITLDDIKLKFIPSLTISHKQNRKLGEFILRCCEVLGGEDAYNFGKLAINSLIGCFGSTKTTSYETAVCSSDINEISAYYQMYQNPFVQEFNVSDQKLSIVTGERDIVTRESRYPIYAQILDMEAMELHKITKKVENNGGQVMELNTDSVLFKAEKPLEINESIDTGDNKLNKYRYEETVKKLACEKKKGYTRKTKCNYKKPKWHTIKYKDHLHEKITDIVIDNGAMVNGFAGSGKTFFVNKVIRRIKEKYPDARIFNLAPTNKACLAIQGKTIDKFARKLATPSSLKSVANSTDFIIVDEVSMNKELSYYLFTTLQAVNKNIRFIMVGDFTQFPTVNDRVMLERKKYKNSTAMKHLCRFVRVVHTECKRSDKDFF